MSRGSSPMRASSPHSSSCATPACTCRTRSTTAGSTRRRGARRSRSRRPTSSTRSSEADYLATTGGSRSTGTPVELSFAWQRRQGVQRAIQFDRAGVRGVADRDLAARVPVGGRVRRGHEDHRGRQPSGAVVLAGSGRPRRHQQPQAAREQVPPRAQRAAPRAGLPSPEHVPTSDPEPVVRWLRRRASHETASPRITGYASSLTAAARWASDHGIDARRRRRVPEQRARHGRKARGDAGRGHAAVPDVRVHSRRHDRPELRRAATTRSTTSGTTSSR